MKRSLITCALSTTLVAVCATTAVAHHAYRETDLVSDLPGRAAMQDTLLVNPWGILPAVHGGVRVADNGLGISTAYTHSGVETGTIITIPPAGSGNPTGIVRNDLFGAFMISSASHSGPSRLIFDSEDGSISGWNPDVDATNAIQVVAGSDAAVYKGIAIVLSRRGAQLLATNFRAGTVDVFDSHFAPVSGAGFTDDSLPAGYAPFNIAVIHGRVFVTYAQQDAEKHDNLSGPGLGLINVFDTQGHLLQRFSTGGSLNAPWGMAVAPTGFGEFGGDLLVGNFGDGVINVFDLRTGNHLGALADTSGAPISISGLWGLTFASNAENEQDCDREDEEAATLFFAAGIEDESHGLLGTIQPAGSGGDVGEGGHHDGDHHGGDQAVRASVQVAVVANPVHLSRANAVQMMVTADPPATVGLRIYDAAGRLVAEPMHDVPVSGSIVTQWNIVDQRGMRVPPGTYFYHATVAGGVARGRFVLLR